MTERTWSEITAYIVALLILATGCSQTSAATSISTLPAAFSPAIVPASTLDLSGVWQFQVDPQAIGQRQGWANVDFDDSTWTRVTIPHTWNVMPEHDSYSGVAWYRRRFAVPAETEQAHLRLRFEAVFYLAHVWVNGAYVGEHSGGYTPFELDVTGVVEPGENVVAVQVDNQRAMDRIPATLNPAWSFDWYNYGGIVRGVSLIATSSAFIAQQPIVAVPHLIEADRADYATVTITATLKNLSTREIQGTLVARVFDDASGSAIPGGQITAPVTLALASRTIIPLALTLDAPKLWHFDHPNLYRVTSALLTAQGEVVHTESSTFGIRPVDLKDARLYLNGEPVRLVGLSRHADSPEHGLAETTTVMAADYDDLKTLNEVLSRPVHYPQSEFILDYCDRKGILLIPEVPAWQLTAAQMSNRSMRELEKQQLGEMIAQGFNHPSIWAWSIANEIQSETPEGKDFVREMIGYVKSLDGTRPVSFASNQLYPQPQRDATAVADFVLMNQYIGTWAGQKTELGPALEKVHAAWPDKTVMISEFGFEPRWNKNTGPNSSLDPSQYYFAPADLVPTSEGADTVRRQLIHD